jgi:hypothetical protein
MWASRKQAFHKCSSDANLIGQHWLTFFVNTLTILGVSVAIYIIMRYRGDVLKRYSDKVQKK